LDNKVFVKLFLSVCSNSEKKLMAPLREYPQENSTPGGIKGVELETYGLWPSCTVFT